MKLTVIIPTYNRAKLLGRTLNSVGQAAVPAGLEIEVIVVNNNSSDETESVVREWEKRFSHFGLKYLFEKEQGRSSAVNAGINQADGDLLAMIDDDIQIQPDWFREIAGIFTKRWDEIDFVGGKVLPIWEIEPPKWVISIKDVGVCWRDYGEKEWWYDQNSPILTGGHAVLKAEVFKEVGLYAKELGVKKKNLASCEDDVMFDKLLEAGKRGIYSPKLVVNHFVSAHRLSKNYYRQWHFGAGMSWNLVEKNYKPYSGAKILQVPRYMYREAAKSILKKIRALLRFDESASLQAEKEILLFLGFFYARNIKDSRLNNPLQKLAERTRVAER
jgi:glucosyl-dolichyl phosphate glucuronosyltransferase